MKNSRFFILSMVMAILALAAGGYWYWRTNTPVPGAPQQSTACADFNSFASFALGTIGQSEPTRDITVEATSTNNVFEWKRNAAEPFITYPFFKVASRSTSWVNAPGDISLEKEAAAASSLLQSNVVPAAEKFGLINNAFNTLLLQSHKICFSNDDCERQVWGSSNQRWGFTKGSDLYSVRLDADTGGGQAPGSVQVTIGCAIANSNYDHAYDLLLSPSNSKLDRSKTVNINQFASDRSAVRVNIWDFYSLINGEAVLVSSGSSLPVCQALERHRVGLGMPCMDAYSIEHRNVSYANASLNKTYNYTNTTFNYQLQVPPGFSILSADESTIDRGYDIVIFVDDGSEKWPSVFSVWIYGSNDPRRADLPRTGDDVVINGVHWLHTARHTTGEPVIEIYWVSHGDYVYMLQYYDSASNVAYKSIAESMKFIAP